MGATLRGGVRASCCGGFSVVVGSLLRSTGSRHVVVAAPGHCSCGAQA